MSDLLVRPAAAPPLAQWELSGTAIIDERPATDCTLVVRGDGTWAARISTFTLAGAVDLLFVSGSGGHFCGPADVARSRADSHPLRGVTELIGSGPLLVVAPTHATPELTDGGVVDGEVVNV